ncbi:MAG: DMT family transporter [Eubacteriales bacterium]
MIFIKNKQIRGTLLLALCALIWGSAFVAQSEGANVVGPFTFNAARCIMSFIVLIPAALFVNSRDREYIKANGGITAKNLIIGNHTTRDTLLSGLICGVILFISMTLQQIGLSGTDAGKAGFITALYIVFVPVFGVVLRRRVPKIVWACVAAALVGLYLLCIKPGSGFSVAPSDIFVLMCAICFSFHIMAVDHYSPRVNGIMLSGMQFLVAAILSSILMLIFEKPAMSDILAAIGPIAYAGIMSGAVAYTLQIIGQKDAEPTVASLVMSLESVFAVLSGWLILGQALTPRELFGCTIIFLAIIATQLPLGRRAKRG